MLAKQTSRESFSERYKVDPQIQKLEDEVYDLKADKMKLAQNVLELSSVLKLMTDQYEMLRRQHGYGTLSGIAKMAMKALKSVEGECSRF